MEYLMHEVSVEYRELDNSDRTYKWLYDNSLRIGLDVKEVIDEFYKKYITSSDKVYRYIISPLENEATKNPRMRFMLVEFENDFVLAPLKMVDPIGKERFFTISMEPISLNDINSNILKVLSILREFDCVKYIVVAETEKKDEVDNNYYNLFEDFKNMDRSTWRSKRGVNKLKPLIDFDNNAEIMPGIDDMVLVINGVWNDIKKSKNSKEKLSANNDMKLAKLAMSTGSLFIYSFSYKGKMIGYSIAEDIIGKYAALVCTKQITNDYEALVSYIGEDTDELKLIHKHLSSFMQYMIHKDIFTVKGYEGVYNYGDLGIKGLRDFKLDYYSRIIHYNRYSLEDYMNDRFKQVQS